MVQGVAVGCGLADISPTLDVTEFHHLLMRIGLLRNRIQRVGTIEIINDIRGSRIHDSTISTCILVGMRQGDDCPALE
ncbi:hypothetical protein D3C84_713770 [compost metagenome]